VAGDEPLIDHKALENIRKLQRAGAPCIVDKVLQLYFRDSPRHICTMREALAARDAVALKRAAHTLKSNSANVGALQLAASCKAMEAQSSAEPTGEAEQLIARIELEYSRAHAALAKQTAGA
jgi:HPt (histidine-containing phosphotransfer) domain-containing protein